MIDWEKIPFEAIIDACTRGLEQMKEQEKKMTNPKTYYCAWHPEKGYNEETISNAEGKAWEKLADKKVKSFIAFCSQGYGLLKSQGWQVKEVVIVEKGEFDKLRKEEANDK